MHVATTSAPWDHRAAGRPVSASAQNLPNAMQRGSSQMPYALSLFVISCGGLITEPFIPVADRQLAMKKIRDDPAARSRGCTPASIAAWTTTLSTFGLSRSESGLPGVYSCVADSTHALETPLRRLWQSSDASIFDIEAPAPIRPYHVSSAADGGGLHARFVSFAKNFHIVIAYLSRRFP